ncbi:hypothetical protein AB0M28_33570 [Streptomyces sp. NPDC051940]|uniref:hypothetical protein n=1 Tax=Streptomyces sp. NPDC051940 TaxID=3155675 RepID=UPI0034420642
MTFTCFSAGGRTWPLTHRIGSGSEGAVYAVDGPGSLVAKLVPDAPPGYRRRIERLVRQRREPRTVALLSGTPARVAWPLEAVRTGTGAQGYLMPDMRVAFRPLGRLLTPVARQERMPAATWRTGLAAAGALARLLAEAHAEGYVVGDLKPDNLWVDDDGRIGAADVDSWQFTDGGETFPGRMSTPGYTPPERLGADAAAPRAAGDDFVLAVLVHQLLMSGLHPFTGIPGDGGPYVSLDDNVLRGRSRLLDPASVELPRSAPPVDVLPRRLTALFVRAFTPGRRRPEAAEWAQALEAEQGRLACCPVSGRHVHTVERPWCPWCDQAARGGDSYPAPVAGVAR